MYHLIIIVIEQLLFGVPCTSLSYTVSEVLLHCKQLRNLMLRQSSTGPEKHSITQFKSSHVFVIVAQIKHDAYLSLGSTEVRPDG